MKEEQSDGNLSCIEPAKESALEGAACFLGLLHPSHLQVQHQKEGKTPGLSEISVTLPCPSKSWPFTRHLITPVHPRMVQPIDSKAGVLWPG